MACWQHCRCLLLSRRWLTFSLRSFFVVLTIGCVWLGLKVEQVRKQREASAKIREMGGSIFYDWQRPLAESLARSYPNGRWPREEWHPPGPAWLRGLVGDDFFQRVDGVEFDDRVDAQAFAVLAEFPELRSAGFSRVTVQSGVRLPYPPRVTHPQITDVQIKFLTRCERLEEACLRGTAITDEGLKCLSSIKRLQWLELSDTRITDDGLRTLKGIRTLKGLGLRRATVTGQGITEIMKALPACEVYR